jgi:hypothetical protein
MPASMAEARRISSVVWGAGVDGARDEVEAAMAARLSDRYGTFRVDKIGLLG